VSAADKLAANGGGVVVGVLPDSRGWVVQVESRRGRDFQPATQVIMLRPGYAAVPLALESNGPIRLDAGARLILPTTDSGARNLVELLARLDQFSPDVTWTTLAALCAPSLDLRVRRLEERLERGSKSGTPPAGNGTVARMADQGRTVWGLVRARPLVWSLSTLSALLAFAIVWDAARGFETSRRAIARLKHAPAATASETALASLRTQLEKTQDGKLKALYDTHFQFLHTMKPGGEGAVLSSRDVAYGLVWLMVIQAKDPTIKLPDGGPVVGNRDHEKAARQALQVLRKGLDADRYALLVDVTCRAFAENVTVNKPGLPAFDSEERANLPRGWCRPGVPVRGLQVLADGIAP
jgi:hypothetical protein